MLIDCTMLTCFMLCLLIPNIASVKWTEETEESLDASILLDELDFDDTCTTQVAEFAWNTITNNNDQHNFEALEEFADIQRVRALDNADHKQNEYPQRTEVLARKLELVSYPGDVILPAEKYSQLLVFADDVTKAITKRRIDCEKSIICNLTSRDPDQLLASWKELSLVNSSSEDILRRYPDILKLATDAAQQNGSPDVESYWLMLSELPEDGYQKAKKMWEDVKPLYQKLHHLAAKSLLKQYGPNAFQENNKTSLTFLPSYLLGSRLGSDWTNIADLVLSPECKQVFDHIETSLLDNMIVGKSLYQKAEKITQFLGVGKLDSSFWEHSLFDLTCPARYVDPCRADPRVAACNTTSWTDYLDAHEITMRSRHSQLFKSTQQASYLFQAGNRYSAVEEGIAGLASMIATNRHYLTQQDILHLPNNAYVKDTLLMLLALRVLPKLPYYLVADLARLEAIRTNQTADIGKIWRQLKLNEDMQGISTPENEWWTFLEDPHIAANKPYISHFYGVFIQFQLFEELLSKDESTSDDAEVFIRSRDEFRTLLELGRSKKWPELLQETFKTNVDSYSLIRFFDRLNSLLSPVPKVPKEVHTIPPPIQPVVNKTEDSPQLPSVKNQSNSTLVIQDPVPSNATTEDLSEESTGVGHYLLIAFAIVVVIALLVVVVSYGRKYIKKKHNYQRPVNQPA